MTMMFAGSDTTSHTLAFLLHALANHPAAQDRQAPSCLCLLLLMISKYLQLASLIAMFRA